MAAVVVALLGLLAYRQIDRWRGESVTVWVAAADLEPGTRVAAEHLRRVESRAREVAEGVVVDRRAIVGQDLVQAKPAGAPFLGADLEAPEPEPDYGLAGIVPEGRVLMTLDPPSGLPVAELAESWRLGDRFDIFAFGDPNAGPLHMARDAVYLGWVQPRGPDANGGGNEEGVGFFAGIQDSMESAVRGGQGPSASSPLMLAVRPIDVRRLVWVQASRAPYSIVLHGRHEVAKEELLDLPEPPPRNEIEIITGARRQKIPLQGLQ